MKRKLFSILLMAVLCLSFALCVSAATGEYVYDQADLLSSSEEAQLTEKLSGISRQYNAQIVVMTVPTANGSVDWFVENVFDSMGMGYGENHDGVLLLICMDSRDYRILSNGYAGEAIDIGCIDAIGEAIVSDLSSGEYADAFAAFADHCAYYLDGYLNGFPFNTGKNLLVAVVIGLVVGIAVAMVLKNQLKSVRQQRQANVYVKTGSMQVTTSRDLFLYRELSRTRKASSQSSGSGSSRSVGGGKF